MNGSSLPLLVAVGLFLAMVLWRVRPALGSGRRPGASRAEIDAHLKKAEAAKDEAERAVALCDAADLLTPRAALGLYLRAMKADPASVTVVDRAVAGLKKRPRALEAGLWRHLAGTPWTAHREATEAALAALQSLYEGPRRNPLRARFVAQARAALGGTAPPTSGGAAARSSSVSA